MVDDLLKCKHNGHTQMRISVNPELIIKRIELGTSDLLSRIDAANKMFRAGYRIGLNIALIILIENWKKHYIEHFKILHKELDKDLQKNLFIEIIFMTYGYANISTNQEAFQIAITSLIRILCSLNVEVNCITSLKLEMKQKNF